jgi:hypothetical protein
MKGVITMVGICEMARSIDDITGVWEDLKVEDATAHELFSEYELRSEVLYNFLCDFIRKAVAKAKAKAQREMAKFLDSLDSTREQRYSKGKAVRERMLNQGKGFRSDWSAYLSENICNLYS